MSNNLFGQDTLPQKVRISKGHFKVLCGKCRPYHDTYFDRYLDFELADSSIWFRKKENKRFKKISAIFPSLLLDSHTYEELNNLHENFSNYSRRGDKFAIYRIEIFYYNYGSTIPTKINSMICQVYIEAEEPNIIEKIIMVYRTILKNAT